MTRASAGVREGARRTRIGQAVRWQPQLAGSAQICEVHKAAEHVQSCIHGAHPKDTASNTDDVLTGGDRRRGVDVGEKLNEKPRSILSLAVLADDHLVALLHVCEGMCQIVQRALAAVQRSRGGGELT